MNIKKIAVLFSLVLCAVRMNAQEKSLEEIQKQVRDLQSQFTSHYNSVFVDYKTKISQGQDRIQKLQERKKAELDSLEILKSKFQSDFDRDKVFYQNHEMLSELTNSANSAIDKGLSLNDMETYKSYCKEGFSGSLIDCYTSNKGVVALFITEAKYLKKLDNILGDTATIRILFWFEKQNYIFTLDNLNFSNFKRSRNFYFNKSEEEIEKSKEIEKFIEKYNLENQNEYTVNGGVPRLSALDKNKLIDLTNSKQAIEAKSNLDRVIKETGETSNKFDREIMKIQSECAVFDLKKLMQHRISDSTELVKLHNYYIKQYPEALLDYETKFSEAVRKDKLENEQYDKKLARYDSLSNAIQLLEALVVEEAIKNTLNDPYSAKFESYQVLKLPETKARFPCVNVYVIGVNAKNMYGAYSGLKYYAATVINGKMFGGVGKPSDDIYGILFSYDALMSQDYFWNVGGGFPNCYESLNPPVKNINTASALNKPKLNQFNFKYSN